MQLQAGYTELHTGVIPPGLKIGGAQGANHLSFLFGSRARVAGKGRLIKSNSDLKTDSEKNKCTKWPARWTEIVVCTSIQRWSLLKGMFSINECHAGGSAENKLKVVWKSNECQLWNANSRCDKSLNLFNNQLLKAAPPSPPLKTPPLG